MTAQAFSGPDLISSPVRRRIIDILTGRGAMTAAEVGRAMDVHVTTARFHLDQLVAGGLLDATFRKQTGAGRPRKLYAIRPGSFHEGRRDQDGLGILTDLLAETFAQAAQGASISPAEAGRRWALEHVPPSTAGPADTAGRWLAKIGEMVDVLDEWGYTPEVATTDGGRTAQINLTNCPFVEVARKHPAVVCGIHRGLISGALERLGEPKAHVSLEPFVAPFLCRAHVTTERPFRAPTLTRSTNRRTRRT